MSGHLLQSTYWEQYQKLENKPTIRVSGDNFDALILKNQTKVGDYLYLPYGPTLVKQEPVKNTIYDQPLALSQAKKSLLDAILGILSTSEAQKAFMLRIEPTYRLEPSQMAEVEKTLNQKLAKSSSLPKSIQIKKTTNLDPEHTWILPLEDKTEEQILADMESRKARYWRNYAKKGISIRISDDPSEVKILTKFLKNLSEKDNFTPQTEQHLYNQLKEGHFAKLYLAEITEFTDGTPLDLSNQDHAKQQVAQKKSENIELKPKTPIAASIIYDFEGVRHYAHAATDFEHRKLMAGTILLIQMIMDAKNNGAKIYDFWGITTSEDKNHPWYGFTQYKKSFGGQEFDYTGTYDIIINPAKYKLYSSLRKLNRFVRKIRK